MLIISLIYIMNELLEKNKYKKYKTKYLNYKNKYFNKIGGGG